MCRPMSMVAHQVILIAAGCSYVHVVPTRGRTSARGRPRDVLGVRMRVYMWVRLMLLVCRRVRRLWDVLGRGAVVVLGRVVPPIELLLVVGELLELDGPTDLGTLVLLVMLGVKSLLVMGVLGVLLLVSW